MNTNENVNNNHHLKELGGSNYKIAEGQDNIKGWDVKDGQGNELGEVDELIFDDQSLKVRYLVLDLDKNKDLGLKDRKVLIPIGMAQLDEKDDNVILRNISLEQIRTMPDYDKDNLNADYEYSNYNSLTGVTGASAVGTIDEDFYNNEHFNDDNLYRNRKYNSMDNITDENKMDETLNRDRNEVQNTIPIIEEQLNVGKREVDRGGIRITSSVIETPVEKNINLREEHVTVERTPVDRPASQSDFDNSGDQNIEVHERAEVPVVNKEARVVEEIKLKKEVTEHEESIKDTLRSTDVNVNEVNRNDRGTTDKV